jgi:hypothetical protein
MGAVMIRCPETGQDIPTGIVADRKSFAATPVFFARAYCPICRTEHEWFAREAWVCEAEPRRRQGALSLTRPFWRRQPSRAAASVSVQLMC